MIRGGHLLRPVHSHRAPLWVALVCGGCGCGFTGNAYSVPQFNSHPACSGCWARVNRLRAAAGMDQWDTPEDAYPPEGAAPAGPPPRRPGAVVLGGAR